MGFIVKIANQEILFKEYLLITDKDAGDNVCILIKGTFDDDIYSYIHNLQYDDTMVTLSGIDKYISADGNYFIMSVIDEDQAMGFEIIDDIAIDAEKFANYISLPF